MKQAKTKIVPIPGTSDFALIRGKIFLEKLTLQESRALSTDRRYMIIVVLFMGKNREPIEYAVMKTDLSEITKKFVEFPKLVEFYHEKKLQAHIVIEKPEIEKTGTDEWIYKIVVSEPFISKNSGRRVLFLEYLMKRISADGCAKIRKELGNSKLPEYLFNFEKKVT